MNNSKYSSEIIDGFFLYYSDILQSNVLVY